MEYDKKWMVAVEFRWDGVLRLQRGSCDETLWRTLDSQCQRDIEQGKCVEVPQRMGCLFVRLYQVSMKHRVGVAWFRSCVSGVLPDLMHKVVELVYHKLLGALHTSKYSNIFCDQWGKSTGVTKCCLLPMEQSIVVQ